MSWRYGRRFGARALFRLHRLTRVARSPGGGQLHGGTKTTRRFDLHDDRGSDEDNYSQGLDTPPLKDRLRLRAGEPALEPVPSGLLRQYIGYARQYVQPTSVTRSRTPPLAGAQGSHRPSRLPCPRAHSLFGPQIIARRGDGAARVLLGAAQQAPHGGLDTDYDPAARVDGPPGRGAGAHRAAGERDGAGRPRRRRDHAREPQPDLRGRDRLRRLQHPLAARYGGALEALEDGKGARSKTGYGARSKTGGVGRHGGALRGALEDGWDGPSCWPADSLLPIAMRSLVAGCVQARA